jgi:hypothetical protein
VHDAQHGRVIHRVCQQCHHRGRCNPHPQGSKEEEGCGSSVRQCSSEVPDGVPPRPHLPTSLAAVAPVSVVAMDFPPTSAPAPTCSTQDPTSTTASATPACTTDCWKHLWPHQLQLWSLRPLHSRVPHTKEELHSGPCHPSTTWSAKGGRCKDRPRQLHRYGRHSRG